MRLVKFLLSLSAIVLLSSFASAVHNHVSEPMMNDFSDSTKNIQHDCEGMRILRNKLQIVTELNQNLKAQIVALTREGYNVNSFQEDIVIYPMVPNSYASCQDALKAKGNNGIYTISLANSKLKPFEVYCMRDPKNGTAWTIFQRRINGSVDFLRDWVDYKNGFGNLNGEFWLGLDKLHALTNSQQHELWVQLEDFDGNSAYAKYKDILVADESTRYTLIRLGRYEGDAGDSLSYHRGQKFSTFDRDNDSSQMRNCAETYSGAWWYNSCHLSNLNGLYLHGEYSCDMYGKGVVWQSYRDFLYSLKYTHMAIRPMKST